MVDFKKSKRAFPVFRIMGLGIFLTLGAMFYASPVRAQPIVLNDGGFTWVNGVTNDYRIPPTFWHIVIGNNLPNTYVLVSNSGFLWDSGAHVGQSVNSKNNRITVTGTGSRWTSAEIQLGVNGSGNTITNINGGQTYVNGNFYSGYEATSHSNVVEVSGPGSGFRQVNGSCAIGRQGDYNRLLIQQGGDATNNPPGRLSLGEFASSGNNSVEITGPGSTWEVNSILAVGYQGDDNSFVVSNGAYVLSSYTAIGNAQGASIGSLAGADHNRALVTGPGSRWAFATTDDSSDPTLYVGEGGSGNQLTVSEGALIDHTIYIYDLDIIVGYNEVAVSNRVIVTGSGSSISNNGLFVIGFLGDDNLLEITQGGRLANEQSWLGYIGNADNNRAVVDGAGSSWSNSGDLVVGYSGDGNSLIITNGGIVTSSSNNFFDITTIGEFNGANNNRVLVDGAASRWNIAGRFALGNAGSYNKLQINNGAIVNANFVTLGLGGGISNILSLSEGAMIASSVTVKNKCRIEGNGLISSATILDSGGTLAPGFSTGIITNNGNVTFNGGSIFDVEVNGTAPGTQHDQLIVHGSVTINAATLNVTPSLATAFNAEIVIIQNDGADAVSGQFTGLPEGATVTTFGGVAFAISYVGGTGNDVVLYAVPSGPIHWTANSGNYHDAARWTPNFVPRVYDDANFTNAANITWTNDAAAKNAVFNTRDGGSSFIQQNIGAYTWTLTESYILGRDVGANSRVQNNSGTIAARNESGTALFEVRRGDFYFNGGTVIADRFVVTNSSGRFNFTKGTLITGEATIDVGFTVGNSGSGPAIWSVQSNTVINKSIYIGALGGANAEVLITNRSALVVNTSGFSYLGDRSSSTNNRVLISKPGSKWINSRDVFSFSAGNTLEVSGGGYVLIGRSMNIGNDSSNGASSSNRIVVTGSGSTLIVSNTFTLGYDSPANQLTVSSGGYMESGGGTIGSQSGADHNRASVSGAGSRWNISQTLVAGSSSAGNSLMVSNGGLVTSESAYLGLSGTSSNNAVTVAGSGSSWTNTGNFYIGSDGDANTLHITGGGRVDGLYNARIGGSTGSDHNMAIVNGTGSIWFNANDLYAGDNGAFNSLLITNGGLSIGRGVEIGRNSSSSNNTVTITDPGSLLYASNAVIVGASGSFNTLRIANGGRVVNHFFTAGGFAGSSGNRIIVEGPQSVLESRGDTYMGSSGSFNTMIVSNGGTFISSNFMYIGFTGSNNTLRVEQGGRVAMNSGYSGSYLAGPAGNRLDLRGGHVEIGGNFNVSSNNYLSGYGTLSGSVFILGGGIIDPGEPIGTLIFSNNPSENNDAEIWLDLAKSGGATTNDQIIIREAVTFNGKLLVTHLGPDPLEPGDTFQLYDTPGYFGAFDEINLPVLGAGLSWTNTMLTDGSITVVGEPVDVVIDDVMKSGDDFVYRLSGGTPSSGWELLAATNLLPPALWITNLTGTFDLSGNAVITNSIDPGYLERYYRFGPP